MIAARIVIPGEQIRQDETARLLDVSRVPLREALKVLETEGTLTHIPNRGYFVVSLGQSELTQIYRMRRLLETELLESLSWPDSAEIERLTAINAGMRAAHMRGDVKSLVDLNRKFHFAIFGYAEGKTIILREIERLWALSDSYRTVHFYQSAARERAIEEHEAVILALARRERSLLIRICDDHRVGLQEHLATVLGEGQEHPDAESTSSEPA
jgi:DNA-binding GntR family transcriptional regulator